MSYPPSVHQPLPALSKSRLGDQGTLDLECMYIDPDVLFLLDETTAKWYLFVTGRCTTMEMLLWAEESVKRRDTAKGPSHQGDAGRNVPPARTERQSHDFYILQHRF